MESTCWSHAGHVTTDGSRFPCVFLLVPQQLIVGMASVVRREEWDVERPVERMRPVYKQNEVTVTLTLKNMQRMHYSW